MWLALALTLGSAMAADSYWTPRSDAELAQTLAQTCKAAKKADQPVLLTFSAPWCIDCKKIHMLEGEEPLAAELKQWSTVVIDVGRFDRHTELLGGFGIERIAYWAALKPECGKPVTEWTRLKTGVFEPASGEQKSAEDLAGWLREARGAK